jgi:hypothetical protein
MYENGKMRLRIETVLRGQGEGTKENDEGG